MKKFCNSLTDQILTIASEASIFVTKLYASFVKKNSLRWFLCTLTQYLRV